MRNRISIAIFLISSFYCSIAQQYTVGISTDFPKNELTDSLFAAIVNEIDRTLGSTGNFRLPNDQVIYDNADLDQAQESYNQLRTNDFILLVGAISTVGALQNESFDVPSIAIGVVDPELQGIPYQDGKSGRKNFTYIWTNQDAFRQIQQFRRIADFGNLTILSDPKAAVTFRNPKGLRMLDSLSSNFDITIDIVPVEGEIADVIASIPESAEAVYVSNLIELEVSRINKIAEGLKERKLPSFTSNKWHVRRGILSSTADENDLSQVARRLAIMVDDALTGTELADMSVLINFKETFSINLETARAIDLSPPFEVLFTAELIQENESDRPKYSLEEILQKSIEQNIDIQLVNRDMQLASQDVTLARSSMLPNLSFGLSARQINSLQANNFNPEQQALAQFSLDQVIFSEQAIASIKIARYLNDAQTYQTRSQILNILLDTYILYFNVLAAKTDLLVQKENLNNSLQNLEIARVKRSTGASSAADIYRWESEVANSRQLVIESEIAVRSALLELNTQLANTLEDNFDIEDVTIDGEVYQEMRDNTLSDLISRPADFSKLSRFLVTESQRSNPNKLELLSNVQALERQKLRDKRLLYTPNISLQASAGSVLGRGGVGSQEVAGFTPADHPWQVGVSLSYPIFQGRARRANLQKSNVQLEQINYSQTQLNQNLELLVRTNLLSALSANTNINFSHISADNATDNYYLVRDNYQQGLATITQLIDAQNAALNARLNNALSIYNFMIASLQVEFAVGFFSMLSNDEDMQEFEDRFIQFINEND